MHYKLFVKTYGCQMNMYDSIKMQDLLAPHGFENTEEIAEANLVILNTCHIREKASEKVFSELGRINKLKNKAMAAGRDYYICVAGCVAQAEGEEIFRRAPYVDIVVGPQSYQNLPILIEKVKRKEKWVLDLDFQEDEKFDKLPEEAAPQGAAAFLTVQEGCDKFCHFCCVPYTRGQEYSRTPEEVIREAMKIAAQGTCEITLLGQNVTAYSRKDEQGREWNLPQLIEAIAGIAGIKRIRYTTSHPIDMTDELIEAHRTIPKLMPYLHLPVQSGSDRILKAMNRNHNRDLYFKIIKKFEAAIPNMAFSSDFIVGYPGETEKDFEDTLDLVERINYGECYSFKYSPRPGTPAASLANTVDEETKSRRLKALQELIVKKQSDFNHSKVGEVLEVLVDGNGKYQGQMVGKSPYMQTVNINDCPSSFMGKVVSVKITSASRFTLNGELCGKEEKSFTL